MRENKFRKFFLSRKLWFSLAFFLLTVFYFSLPDPLFNSPFSTVVYDRDMQLLNARIATDGQWRFPHSEVISEKFETCLLEFEDQYFYQHPGVNLVSLTKAFYKNLSGEGKRIGGSTLTMQLVRLSRGNRERTYLEKLIECWMAFRIECSYKKKSILSYYANNAPFGGNVVGIRTASWRYFGKEAQHLSWAESALLAVLPNAPSLIYPGKNHGRLLQKRNALLKRLYQKGILDEATFQLALREEIPGKPLPLPQFAPHLMQRIINENGEGKMMHTTLQKRIQILSAALVQKHIAQYQSNQINNACALILDTQSGRVIAYVGNTFSLQGEDQHEVDVIAAPRSSGSLLKPILYASLLHEGKIAPRAWIEDVPLQIGSYAPKNYNLTYDGLVPANEALSRSLNVPAVKQLQMMGTAPFLDRLRKLGFTTLHKPANYYGLSLILGGAEVTAWDLAGVYASLGRTLITYDEFHQYRKQDIHPPVYRLTSDSAENKVTSNPLLTAGSLWTTFNAMNELARPEDYATGNSFSSIHKIAWKTGTSFGFRDAWAVGLNKKYTIVVWVGNADGEGRPGLTGINVAAPLLFSLFNMLSDQAWFKKPGDDLVMEDICVQSGFRASGHCSHRKKESVPVTVRKSAACSFHRLLHTDSLGRYQVNSLCYPVSKMKQKSYLRFSPLQEYFYKRKHVDFVEIPAMMEGCLDEGSEYAFDLIYPRNGFKIYLPLNEFGRKNSLIMNATHTGHESKLFWYLDGRYVGETNRFHQLEVLPPAGKHVLELMDEKGKSLKARFEIVDKKQARSKKL
jgi:penicillin-binding protein 1C